MAGLMDQFDTHVYSVLHLAALYAKSALSVGSVERLGAIHYHYESLDVQHALNLVIAHAYRDLCLDPSYLSYL